MLKAETIESNCFSFAYRNWRVVSHEALYSNQFCCSAALINIVFYNVKLSKLTCTTISFFCCGVKMSLRLSHGLLLFSFLIRSLKVLIGMLYCFAACLFDIPSSIIVLAYWKSSSLQTALSVVLWRFLSMSIRKKSLSGIAPNGHFEFHLKSERHNFWNLITSSQRRMAEHSEFRYSTRPWVFSGIRYTLIIEGNLCRRSSLEEYF